jgi:hypothetical protein
MPITQSGRNALGAALTTVGGSAVAVAGCHTLKLDCDGWENEAVCGTLLPTFDGDAHTHRRHLETHVVSPAICHSLP